VNPVTPLVTKLVTVCTKRYAQFVNNSIHKLASTVRWGDAENDWYVEMDAIFFIEGFHDASYLDIITRSIQHLIDWNKPFPDRRHWHNHHFDQMLPPNDFVEIFFSKN
jgi:hypothetical protein